MSALGRALGRLPAVFDPRTLRLSRYLRDVPAPAPARDWTSALPEDLGLYRNDQLGVCGIVSAAHLVKAWTSQHGKLFAPTEYDVIDAYGAIGGYKPGDPTTDRGTDMLSVCKHWRKAGIAGRRIRAFVKLDHDDLLQLRIAIGLFGGVYAGASMPRAAATSTSTWEWHGGVEDEHAIGGWGGHAMAVLGYDRSGVTFATWGRRQRASWAWWLRYVDEAYAVLADEWAPAGELAPNGFDVAALEADLGEIA